MVQKISGFYLPVSIIFLFRHAIHASEVAAIRQRQSKIGNCPGKLINKQRCWGVILGHWILLSEELL
jgi:hypothetical protein